jgi:hypothetical protein
MPRSLRAARRLTSCFIHATDPRATHEVTPEARSILGKALQRTGFGIWMGNFRDILVDREPTR